MPSGWKQPSCPTALGITVLASSLGFVQSPFTSYTASDRAESGSSSFWLNGPRPSIVYRSATSRPRLRFTRSDSPALRTGPSVRYAVLTGLRGSDTSSTIVPPSAP